MSPGIGQVGVFKYWQNKRYHVLRSQQQQLLQVDSSCWAGHQSCFSRPLGLAAEVESKLHHRSARSRPNALQLFQGLRTEKFKFSRRVSRGWPEEVLGSETRPKFIYDFLFNIFSAALGRPLKEEHGEIISTTLRLRKGRGRLAVLRR